MKYDINDKELLEFVSNNMVDILKNIETSKDTKVKYIKKNVTIPKPLNDIAVSFEINFSECLREGIYNKINSILLNK